VLERGGQRWSALGWGRVSPPGELALPARLALLAEGLEEVLERWRPDVVACEASFHGRSTRSLIVLAQARGALLLVVARAGIPIVEYAPAEVKSAVTGSGRADKIQVARMVSLQLGLAERPVADAADALAVALCFTVRSRGALAEAAAAPTSARKSQNRLKL
jgi:crossover junction endodeoxyribonuclease RuvC